MNTTSTSAETEYLVNPRRVGPSEREIGSYGRLEPRVTHCANALLALALELEATRGCRAAIRG